MLKKLVAEFDGTGLTIKTKDKEPPAQKQDSGQSEVSKMAKRATKLGK